MNTMGMKPWEKLLVLVMGQTTVVNQLKLEKNIPETAAIISAVIETLTP
jgi:hypothetical protein